MGGGKGGGGGQAPFQDELAGMYAGQNMLSMAQRNPYAAAMFRPGTKLGDSYKDLFGTSQLPEARPFKLDPIGAYSMAASRIYGGAQPELNNFTPQPTGVMPGGNFGGSMLPAPPQAAPQRGTGRGTPLFYGGAGRIIPFRGGA